MRYLLTVADGSTYSIDPAFPNEDVPSLLRCLHAPNVLVVIKPRHGCQRGITQPAGHSVAAI